MLVEVREVQIRLKLGEQSAFDRGSMFGAIFDHVGSRFLPDLAATNRSKIEAELVVFGMPSGTAFGRPRLIS